MTKQTLTHARETFKPKHTVTEKEEEKKLCRRMWKPNCFSCCRTSEKKSAAQRNDNKYDTTQTLIQCQTASVQVPQIIKTKTIAQSLGGNGRPIRNEAIFFARCRPNAHTK